MASNDTTSSTRGANALKAKPSEAAQRGREAAQRRAARKTAPKNSGTVTPLREGARTQALRSRVNRASDSAFSGVTRVVSALSTPRASETVDLIKNDGTRTTKAVNAMSRAANASSEIAETLAPTDFWSSLLATPAQSKFRGEVHTVATAVALVAKVAHIAASHRRDGKK